MPKIVIISSSIRKGRNSDRVALFFRNFINENKLANAEIIDLADSEFPLFNERLKFQDNPSVKAKIFAEKIRLSDGVIIISPEYNGGYPASLKNVIDLLTDEWARKPVAICTVSSGDFGGSQVLIPLQFTLWKMKAWTIPSVFPVPRVEDSFDEKGLPANKDFDEKRASHFISELLWYIEARKRMDQ